MIPAILSRFARLANRLSRSENGQLRWYAASMSGGAVLVLGAIVVVAV
jgi:hypothetical protein